MPTQHQDPSPYPANNSQPYKMHHCFLNSSLGVSPSFYLSTWNTPPAWAGADSVDASAPDLKQLLFFGYNSGCLKKCLRSQNLHGFILKLTISGHFLRFQDIFILEHMGHTLGNNSHILDGMILPHLSGLNSHRTLSKNLVSTWL